MTHRSHVPGIVSWLGALTLGALFSGCASPHYLSYDHSRAYTNAFVAQADLTRPSVQGSRYILYGVEAAAIRIRVQEATTDEAAAEAGSVSTEFGK